MGTVFLDMVMSLDGFVAGPNNDHSGLHDWYFAPSGNAVGVIDELLNTIGAMIIGRRSFGDQPEGFDTPYKVPHFVLTHTPRQMVKTGGAAMGWVLGRHVATSGAWAATLPTRNAAAR
jgi:dihydrofolate reductase